MTNYEKLILDIITDGTMDVEEAINKGARFIVTDKKINLIIKDKQILLVRDTLFFLLTIVLVLIVFLIMGFALSVITFDIAFLFLLTGILSNSYSTIRLNKCCGYLIMFE